MNRPNEYPPVEGMSIKALKKLLDREEIAESERKNAVWSEIQRRSEEVVKKSVIPDDREFKSTAQISEELFPNVHYQKAEGTWNDPLLTSEDQAWIWFYTFAPFYAILLFLGYLALIDF